MKENKVASLALLSQAVRLLAGPILLIAISDSLSAEQMIFYFSFYNVIALQQLLEMGMGFTIKQFISHDYVLIAGVWEDQSIKRTKSYFRFAFIWFTIISLSIIVFIGFFGVWFFSSYQGDIDWKGPWIALVVSAAVASFFMPFQLLVEGCQYQIELYSAKLVSSLALSITLIICIKLEFDLYSLSISSIVSNGILYLFLYRPLIKIIKSLKKIKEYGGSNRMIFIKLWPMLSKISVTWITGYFFWNSFNLIAFKNLPPETAGKFAFTLGLAKSGYHIAESIVSAQSTIYANKIAQGKVREAVKTFEKVQFLSILLLFSGYMFYVLIAFIFPQFFIFSKTLDMTKALQIFLYFLLLLPVVLQANFCRCFKVEPYLFLSLFCNISIPSLFYLSLSYYGEVVFIVLLPISIMLLIWSKFLYKELVFSRYN